MQTQVRHRPDLNVAGVSATAITPYDMQLQNKMGRTQVAQPAFQLNDATVPLLNRMHLATYNALNAPRAGASMRAPSSLLGSTILASPCV